MRKNFLYAVALLAAGACQRTDVSPVSPGTDSTHKVAAEGAMSGKQATPDGKVACGTNPQTVLPYSVTWAFENGSSTNFTYQALQHYVVYGSRGNFAPPLQMRVHWYSTTCFGPSQAQYMRVYLHSPDGTTRLVVDADPTLTSYATITIPQVTHSTDLYSYTDDSMPGNYYVSIDYGLNGPPYMGMDGVSQSSNDNSNKPLTCINGTYE